MWILHCNLEPGCCDSVASPSQNTHMLSCTSFYVVLPQVWDSGFISIPYNFKISELPGKLLMLQSGSRPTGGSSSSSTRESHDSPNDAQRSSNVHGSSSNGSGSSSSSTTYNSSSFFASGSSGGSSTGTNGSSSGGHHGSSRSSHSGSAGRKNSGAAVFCEQTSSSQPVGVSTLQHTRRHLTPHMGRLLLRAPLCLPRSRPQACSRSLRATVVQQRARMTGRLSCLARVHC